MGNGYRSNPMVPMAIDEFANVYKAYREWPIKWWREVVQNSIDAEATRIELGLVEDQDGSWIASCNDNGTGMDRETLLGAFLTMGGTRKRFGENIGGFGEAKKLIAFAWPEWTIHTRDIMAKGQGCYYDEPTEAPKRVGTRIEARMRAEHHTTVAAAMELLQRSDVRGLDVTINGDRVDQQLVVRPENKVGEVPLGLFDSQAWTAPVFHVKDTNYSAIFLRVKGLYTFTYSTIYREGFGSIVVELPWQVAKHVLQNNRDGLREDGIGRAIDKIYSDIVTEGERAFKPQSFTKTWGGSGFVGQHAGYSSLTDLLLEKTNRVPRTQSEGKGTKLAVSIADMEQLKSMLKVLKDMGVTGSTENSAVTFQAPPEVVDALFGSNGTADIGVPTEDSIATQLAWQPAFMVDKDPDQPVDPPEEFFLETLSERATLLIKTWTEACRVVMALLGSTRCYGVGFKFSRYALAECREHDGASWLLINPFADAAGNLVEVDPENEILNPKKREDLQLIYAAAVHESTHLADDLSYHNDAFSAALTRNFGLVGAGLALMPKIVRSIKPVRTPKQPGMVQLDVAIYGWNPIEWVRLSNSAGLREYYEEGSGSSQRLLAALAATAGIDRSNFDPSYDKQKTVTVRVPRLFYVCFMQAQYPPGYGTMRYLEEGGFDFLVATDILVMDNGGVLVGAVEPTREVSGRKDNMAFAMALRYLSGLQRMYEQLSSHDVVSGVVPTALFAVDGPIGDLVARYVEEPLSVNRLVRCYLPLSVLAMIYDDYAGCYAADRQP